MPGWGDTRRKLPQRVTTDWRSALRFRHSAFALSVLAAVLGAVLFTSAGAGGQEPAGHLACDAAGTSGPAFFDTLIPYPIPDEGEVHGCFTIDDPGIINKVNVGLGITHTHVGDLIVTLTHEDTATSVVLVERPNVATDPPFGCSGDDISIVLTDQAAASVEDACDVQVPPAIGGTWRPVEPLSAFIGEGIAGTWTLSVSDNAGIDVGTLDSWTLIAAELKDPTATPSSTPSSTPTATLTQTPTATGVDTPAPEKPCGDANDDGAVSSLDALSILQFAAGLINSVPNPSSADVNSDGSIDSLDALLILQLVAGFLNILNCP